MQDHILYLSEADVAGASIPLDRLREVVAEAFAAQVAYEIALRRCLGVRLPL